MLYVMWQIAWIMINIVFTITYSPMPSEMVSGLQWQKGVTQSWMTSERGGVEEEGHQTLFPTHPCQRTPIRTHTNTQTESQRGPIKYPPSLQWTKIWPHDRRKSRRLHLHTNRPTLPGCAPDEGVLHDCCHCSFHCISSIATLSTEDTVKHNLRDKAKPSALHSRGNADKGWCAHDAQNNATVFLT